MRLLGEYAPNVSLCVLKRDDLKGRCSRLTSSSSLKYLVSKTSKVSPNMFSDPIWEHPGLWAIHSQSACDHAEYTSPRKTFDVLSLYNKQKLEARSIVTCLHLLLDIIGIQEYRFTILDWRRWVHVYLLIASQSRVGGVGLLILKKLTLQSHTGLHSAFELWEYTSLEGDPLPKFPVRNNLTNNLTLRCHRPCWSSDGRTTTNENGK